jgi:hypothetical protein
MDVQSLLRAASAHFRTHGGIWLVLVGMATLLVVDEVWAWTPAARRAARTTKLALNNMAWSENVQTRHFYILQTRGKTGRNGSPSQATGTANSAEMTNLLASGSHGGGFRIQIMRANSGFEERPPVSVSDGWGSRRRKRFKWEYYKQRGKNTSMTWTKLIEKAIRVGGTCRSILPDFIRLYIVVCCCALRTVSYCQSVIFAIDLRS